MFFFFKLLTKLSQHVYAFITSHNKLSGLKFHLPLNDFALLTECIIVRSRYTQNTHAKDIDILVP